MDDMQIEVRSYQRERFGQWFSLKWDRIKQREQRHGPGHPIKVLDRWLKRAADRQGFVIAPAGATMRLLDEPWKENPRLAVWVWAYRNVHPDDVEILSRHAFDVDVVEIPRFRSVVP